VIPDYKDLRAWMVRSEFRDLQGRRGCRAIRDHKDLLDSTARPGRKGPLGHRGYKASPGLRGYRAIQAYRDHKDRPAPPDYKDRQAFKAPLAPLV